MNKLVDRAVELFKIRKVWTRKEFMRALGVNDTSNTESVMSSLTYYIPIYEDNKEVGIL